MARNAPPWLTKVVPHHILSIPPYVPGKPVAELERELGITGAVKMASNENPLGPSPMALEAVARHLAESHVYPESSAPLLRHVIASRFRVSDDSVILGNGSDEIMQMLAHVFIRPGDEAVMPANSFSMYRIVVEAFGGKPVRVPLKDHSADLGAMSGAVSDSTRLVFLANPNSPTGTIVSRAEFEAFRSTLRDDGPILVVDEAYREYVRDTNCPNGIDYVGHGVPILVLRTFSKIYGLAGLRVGYGIGEPWLIELLNRVRAPFNVSSLAQVAALAALEDADHLERSRALVREGIDYLSSEIEAMGMTVIPSEANFLTFCLNGDAGGVFRSLLKRGVIVRHLASFGMPEAIRVTVGTAEDNARFVRRLREAIGSEEERASR